MNKRIKRPFCDSVLNNHSYSLEFSHGRLSQYYSNYDTLFSSASNIISDYDTLRYKISRKYSNNLRSEAYYKKITLKSEKYTDKLINEVNRINLRLIDYAW